MFYELHNWCFGSRGFNICKGGAEFLTDKPNSRNHGEKYK